MQQITARDAYLVFRWKLPMIRAIIGLGNPGPRFAATRHNIGFMVLDELAAAHGASWREIEKAEVAEVVVNDKRLYVLKPQTFMNSSGEVVPWLQKKGITPEQIMVVHDELELPFGKLAIKKGGSAKGHNGVRSLIAHGAEATWRLRCGIGRPEQREQVPDYVLQKFAQPAVELERFVQELANAVEQFVITT